MQAARGASLTAPAAVPPGRRRRLLALFGAIAATAYAVDVVTKVLAVRHLTGREDVPVVGEVLQLRLVYNPGAAFSLGTEATVLLSLLAITAVVFISWYSRRLGSRLWAVGLGLLLAGVGGNLTDRLLRDPGPLRGHVVDFLMLPHWPIFNVADICINTGGALVVLAVVRGIEVDGHRIGDEPDPEVAG